MSRTKNAIKNTLYGVLGKGSNFLLSFVSRTIFIYTLGNAYLGINGLYTEILTILSVAELGLGTTLNYAMYKPVAEDNTEKVAQLLDFYKKAYRIIAIVVAFLGCCIFPFLQFVIKGADMVTLSELRLYYVIFLTNTVISYFITYKYSYVNALQKGYITTNFDVIVHTVTSVAQILVLLITKDFLAYLVTQSACLLISRGMIAYYLNKQFPILKTQPEHPLDQESKQSIFKEVKALAISQISSVAVHSTDNIIISSLSGLGVLAVGMVGNYTMLINSVLAFVTIFFSSLAPGFGNLAATSSQERYRDVFREINFVNFWIYGFCSIAFFVLIPPFITLWIGAENQIDTVSFWLILINCYLQGQCTVYLHARVPKGNFKIDVAPSVLQPVVNLIVSIICAQRFGLVGVYIGTVISRLVYMTRQAFSYRFVFGRSAIEYYKITAIYFAATVFSGAVTYLVTQSLLRDVTLGSFVIAVCVVAVVPNLMFLLCFSCTQEFKKTLNRAKKMIVSR